MRNIEWSRIPRVEGRRWLSVGIWAVSTFLAIVCTARALAGAFDTPIGGIVPATVTGVVLCANLMAWSLFVWSPDHSASPEKHRLATGILALVPAAVLGASTSVNAPPWGLGLCMGLVLLGLSGVIVCEGAWLRIAENFSPRSLPSEACTQKPTPSIVTETDQVAADNMGDINEELSGNPRSDEANRFRQFAGSLKPLDECSRQSTLLQQLSRQIASDGSERIEAILLARFQEGESEAVLHLPIHPVLSSMPDVECEPLDESPVSVTVSAALPYGIRVAVTRQATTGELTVPIGIEAAAAPAAYAA